MTSLIRNGTIVTMNDCLEVLHGNILGRDGRIVSVGGPEEQADHVIDARGGYVLPGFVQTHVHLCQTLFRILCRRSSAPRLAPAARVAARGRAHAVDAPRRDAPRRSRAAPLRHHDGS